MKISVLCSSTDHPVYARLAAWCRERSEKHQVELVEKASLLAGGDMLFLISCNEIVDADVRGRYRAALVLHASELPQGRGWSPLVWQIIGGSNDITVSLIEANDHVDTGAVWQQAQLHFAGHELVDELNEALFDAELELMDFAIRHFPGVAARPQSAGPASYYRRRTPEDSRIDPNRSIAEQFNLLRVADSRRYPAFFDHLGQRYEIFLRKTGKTDDA